MIFRRFTPEQNAAILFTFARTLVCGYRAAAQSLTIDEATVFLQFLRGPWVKLYQHYDVNNHLLYSALAKLCTRWFGVSELALRLPSVLAGFFLMLGVYWVLEFSVPSRAVRWVALLAIGVSPMLMDLTIAARGYGLGLALLVWGIYLAMRGRDFAAGALLGLSATAVAVMAVPGAAVVAAVFIVGTDGFQARARRAVEIGVPALAIAFLISYPAFRTVGVAQFYVGEPRIGAAVFNLVFTSIRTSVTRIGPLGTGAAAHAIQFGFLPAVLMFIAAISARTAVRAQQSRDTLIPAVAFAVALAELVAIRYIVGFNYPVERVGIYLFLLLGMAWAIAAGQAALKPARAINGLLAAALLFQFLTQFEWRYFSLWAFDLPAKQVARILQQATGGQDAGSVSVSTSWFQTPALEFYRYHYGIAALKPIERHDPALLTGYDYYVLNVKDDPSVKAADIRRLIPLYREPISGVLVAKEPDSNP